MKIIWTEGAYEDLAGIVKHIRLDSYDSARMVAQVIFAKVMALEAMPYLGRIVDRSRELLVKDWPYRIVYELHDDTIFIEAIQHTSQLRKR